MVVIFLNFWHLIPQFFKKLERYTIFCLLYIYCMCTISLPYFAFSTHNVCIYFIFVFYLEVWFVHFIIICNSFLLYLLLLFFIIYLNFLSWFCNPLKSCRNIKNSFQLFQAYIKTSDLYISLSFNFSFFFGFLVLLCMIVYILRYPFLYRIYLCILWIYFFSLSLCTPFSFFKIIFPSISLLYIITFLL